MRSLQGSRPELAIACLRDFGWSGVVPVAEAQVKLEQKYTEGQKLKYKTTSKMHQTLTLMGMEIESSEERSMITSLSTGKRRTIRPCPWRKR